MSLSTDSNFRSPVTSSQFTFNESDGTIKLKNGRKFTVEISSGDGFKNVSSKELVKLVTNLLDELGQQESFEYKDLSKTSITYDGITTDQKDKTERTYTVDTHKEKYEQITESAQKALTHLKTPVTPKRLSAKSESGIGEEPTDLTRSNLERSSSLVTDDLVQQTDSKASEPIIIDEDESASVDRQLEVTVQKIHPEDQESKVQESKVSETAKKIDQTVEFKAVEKASGSKRKRPEVGKAISKKWGQFLDWLSKNKWLSSKFETLGKRNPAHEIRDSRSAALLAATSQSDEKIDEESRLKFTSCILPLHDESDRKGSVFDHTALTIEQLDKIASEVTLIDGKVKIREQDGTYFVRAGHRVGKSKKRAKGTGTKKASQQAMQVMIKACDHQRWELDNKIKKNTGMCVILNQLDKAPTELSEWKGEKAKEWLEDAKNLSEILDARELKNFISAINEFKSNSSPEQEESKFKALMETKDELQTLLEKNEGALKKTLAKKINSKREEFQQQLETLRSIGTLLMTRSDWGKAVVEKSQETKEIATQFQNEMRITELDIRQLEKSLNPEKKARDDWMTETQFFDEIFSSEDSELREQFEMNYGWMMPSKEYIDLLNSRFQTNKQKLAQADPPIEESEQKKLEGEQSVILEMVANWISEDRIDPNEVDQIVVDDKSIRDVVTALSEEIKGNDAFSEIYERIDSALNTPKVEPDTSPIESKTNYQKQLAEVASGKISKKERKQLLKEMGNDIARITGNTYLKIKPSELTNLAWSKEKTQPSSPNLMEFISQFNNINNYLQLLILTKPGKEGTEVNNIKEQANMIKFLIDLQTQALEKGDLNTAMVINSALATSSVARLSGAWEKVNKGKNSKGEQLKLNEAHLSNEGSSKAQRQFMKDHPEGIPFVGIYLSDLTFSAETKKMTRQELLEEGGETVRSFNPLLLSQVSKITNNILSGQSGREYERPQRALSEEIEAVNSKASGDKALYDLSLKAQPRHKQ